MRSLFTLASLLGLILICSTLQAQIFPSPGSTPKEKRETAFSQTRFLGGVSLAGSLNSFTRGIPMVYTPICNNLEGGAGLGYSLGLHGTYLLTPELSVVVHGRYAHHGGSFERFQAIGRSWTTENGEPGQVTIRIDSEIDYRAVEGDVMVKWIPEAFAQEGPRFGLTAGPYIGVPVSATMSQDHVMEVYNVTGEVLTERQVSTFGGEELNRGSLAEDVEMERIRPLQYGLRVGALADYHIGKGLYLTPALTVDLPVLSLTDFRWGSLTTWSLGVDLSVGL